MAGNCRTVRRGCNRHWRIQYWRLSFPPEKLFSTWAFIDWDLDYTMIKRWQLWPRTQIPVAHETSYIWYTNTYPQQHQIQCWTEIWIHTMDDLISLNMTRNRVRWNIQVKRSNETYSWHWDLENKQELSMKDNAIWVSSRYSLRG
jgi:hypothetical protein